MKISCTIAFLLSTGLIAGCAVTTKHDVSPVSTSITDVPPSSSYACQPTMIDGSLVKGDGAYGCHFYLHHPATHQILANTAYRLVIYPAPANGSARPEPTLTLDGETDTRGRSGYVRAAFPITPDRVKFVERIGSGPYDITPRLIRPTDGLAVPGMAYRLTWCGPPYTGISDEQGYGAAFSTATACAVDVVFYRKR